MVIHFSFALLRRAGGFTALGAVLLLALVTVAGLGTRAALAVGRPAGGAAQGAGGPIAGPAGQLSVVNLRHLPVAPPVSGKTLPFRHNGPAGSSAAPAAAPWLKMLALGADDLGGPTGAMPLLPTLTRGWNGITSEESGGSGGPCGCVPPDGDMSVSPGYVVVDVNQAFRVFNHTGASLAGPIGMDTFFSGCGPSGLTSSDAITAYDPVAGRFTIGILRYNSNTQDSYVSLAVSQTNDPTGSWNRYCFEQLYQGVGFLYDFPHIAVGQNAIYTTGNLYPPNGQQQVSARVNAYNKAQMYSGAVTATQVLTDVVFNSDMTTADTIRPALFNIGLPKATNYFIDSSSTPGSSRVTLWRWTDPFGANSFVQAGGVDIATYVQPVSMLQPAPGQPMPPPAYIDDRTLAAAWTQNTVYGAHTVACNPGGGTNDCIQWYQLGNLDGSPTLLQQGLVGGNNESRAYPNIAVDKYGNVELSYAYSSLNDPIGIRHSGRYANQPPGVLGAEQVIKAGQQAETGFNATRWGDFSGSVTDPNGLDLWHFEEYSQNINDPLGSWGTWTSLSTFQCQSPFWTNTVGVQPYYNTLTKTAPQSSWNAGGVSTLALASGDGQVSTYVFTTTTAVMFGFSHGDSNQSYTDIDYAIYTDPDSHALRIFEDGVDRGAHGPYAVGDFLFVKAQAGVIKYYRNSTLLYTSTVAPTYPLLLDTSILTPHGRVSNAFLCGRSLTSAP